MPVSGLKAILLGLGGLCIACACAEPGSLSRPGIEIVVLGERLSGRIERVPLRDVLAELHRLTGIRGEFIDTADEGTVSESFNDAPLFDALLRLLNGRSFVMVYAPAPGADGSAAHARAFHLLILPRAVAARPQSPALAPPVPASPEPMTNDTVAHTVARPAPADRAPSSGAEHAASALDAFTHAMVDPDESVRARAQERFEQALATETQSAAAAPQPRR